MKHQLKPNTYAICESTEQCKELFEWAKANGLGIFEDYIEDETIVAIDCNGCVATYQNDIDEDLSFWSKFEPMPLPEFIARLKGEWVEGKTVTLSQKDWTRLDGILNGERFDDDYVEGLQAKIKEQLNNQ